MAGDRHRDDGDGEQAGPEAEVAEEQQERRQRDVLDQPRDVAAGASPYASYACVDTWLTDFRSDLPKIDVPTLVVHGTEDRILPFEVTAQRLPALVDDLKLVAVEGGPHNIGWTHPEELNSALLEFLGR